MLPRPRISSSYCHCIYLLISCLAKQAISCASATTHLFILLLYLRFMQPQLLGATSCLSIYYDSVHNYLFLNWAGELTLPAVQEACVAVAQCYLTSTYSRVVTSNLQVTEVGGNIGAWLSAEFLPYLAVVGVKQLAWVSAPSIASRNQAQTVVNRVPNLALTLFDNTEEAIAWLQQTRSTQPEGYRLLPRQPATQVRLAQGVQVLRQEAQIIRQEVQLLHQKVGRRPVTSARV
jgi:hypothetical protein